MGNLYGSSDVSKGRVPCPCSPGGGWHGHGVGAMGSCCLEFLLWVQVSSHLCRQTVVGSCCPVPCPVSAPRLCAAPHAPLDPAQPPCPIVLVSPACLAAEMGPRSQVLIGAWRSPHTECPVQGTHLLALSYRSRRARLGDPTLLPIFRDELKGLVELPRGAGRGVGGCSKAYTAGGRRQFGGIPSSRAPPRGLGPARPSRHPPRTPAVPEDGGTAGACRGVPGAVGWRPHKNSVPPAAPAAAAGCGCGCRCGCAGWGLRCWRRGAAHPGSACPTAVSRAGAPAAG